MSRRTNSVKCFPRVLDLHFHGAFGIDFFNATRSELDGLAGLLGGQGLTAFCPTLLSAPLDVLIPTLENLADWIESFAVKNAARPVGIHLEGPFLSPEASGAHPEEALLSWNFRTLQRLTRAARGHLRILTFAPELVRTAAQWHTLRAWAKAEHIHLSAGHSRATFEQGLSAFTHGVCGVTHAWNAMAFHHRDPGLLGAALSSPEHPWIEVIPDGVHVHTELVYGLLQAAPDRTVFVSDCAPAAGLRISESKKKIPFGPCLHVHRDTRGVCVTDDGALAGGGTLLPELGLRWIRILVEQKNWSPARAQRTIEHCIWGGAKKIVRL